MKPTQNIIHSSAFNFEYRSKTSASRGNALIESIFHSHILPEIEAAISKKIPDGVLIELSRLEINIGTINEKDLQKNLAAQIRASLEKALDIKLDIEKGLNGSGQAIKGQTSGNFIISSIEIFLTKGYFPYALERKLSINELVANAIQNYNNEFTNILKKYRNQDSVIKRTAYNLNQQIVDKIIFALDPVNTDWIIEFRKSLIQLKAEINKQYNEVEFVQMLKYSILKYVLNDSRSAFNKRQFATEVLSGFPKIFQPYFQLVIQSPKSTKGKSTTSVLIEETLAYLQKEQKMISPSENEEIPLERLVKILNTGKVDFSILNPAFLKRELIRVARNKEKRAELGKKLSETGATFMLELFSPIKAQKLYTIIAAFTEKFTRKPDKTSTVNKLVLQTVLYLQESAIREFEPEEFILFLIHSAELDQTKTVQSPAFLHFIQTQKNISAKNITIALKEEQEFHEISSIRNVLFHTQEQQTTISKAQKTDKDLVGEYFYIYKRKIIGYFLKFGYLPPAYKNLSKRDVQQIFIDLLKEKDNFLAVRFKGNEDANNLIDRLNLLTTKRFSDDLQDYLIHFFQNEYSILSKTITGISQRFAFKAKRIDTKSFLKKIFIAALAESKGGNSSAIFTLFMLEHLNKELIKKASEPDKFFRFLILKSAETLEIKTFPETDLLLNQNFNLLFNLLHRNKLELNDSTFKKLKNLLALVKYDEKLFTNFFSAPVKNQTPSGSTIEDKKLRAYRKQLDKLLKNGQTSKEDASAKFNKAAKPETENTESKDLDFYISVLTFYAKKGFFPWWATPISIPGLINKLKKQSCLFPQTFGKVLLQTEKQEHIFEPLIHQLSADLLIDINAIFVNHAILKEPWEKSLQKNKPSEGSAELQGNNSAHLRKSSRLDIVEFIHEAYMDNDLLFKGLYFFTDDDILQRWLAQNPEAKTQIREYLAIAPYFYFRNVTPPIWRQVVFGFSLKYYGRNSKKQSSQFHYEFLNHLKKQHNNVNWTEILTTIFRIIQSSKNKNNVSFPVALVHLLNIEPTMRSSKKNNSDNMENNALITDEKGIETKIYNSGLVLLWPFLTQLFEHLSLAKQGVFIHPDSMNRAVFILQYLVYNETEFPEYELVLNKLLVGMQPEIHLKPSITLTDKEKDTTQSLLNGFISNWEKVKQSTPEGIQETFLQREGILRFKEEAVLLTVEKKGVDVLLHSIPWNFSVIKLSWMKKPIHVEWV